MNIDKLRRAKEIISGVNDSQFNMAHFARKNECGTVACIAGHCLISDFPVYGRFEFSMDDFSKHPNFGDYWVMAFSAFLESSWEEADAIAMPRTPLPFDHPMLDVECWANWTKEQALIWLDLWIDHFTKEAEHEH